MNFALVLTKFQAALDLARAGKDAVVERGPAALRHLKSVLDRVNAQIGEGLDAVADAVETAGPHVVFAAGPNGDADAAALAALEDECAREADGCHAPRAGAVSRAAPAILTDEAALLAGVLDRPDDDLPRLVYADWLEETGDPANGDRAEFIRVQCELAARRHHQRVGRP